MGTLSLDDVSRLGASYAVSPEPFVWPRHIVSANSAEARACFNGLFRNCPAAFEFYVANDLQGLMYDPKEKRIVFPVRNWYGSVVDAVGRSDDYKVKPKWKRYGRSALPFVSSYSGGVGVVVEDAISAVSVGSTELYSGIAILGTALRSTSWASKFRGLIVALDYDASVKALEITRKLQWFCPTVTYVLKKDLKYETKDNIIQQLETSRRIVLNGN